MVKYLEKNEVGFLPSTLYQYKFHKEVNTDAETIKEPWKYMCKYWSALDKSNTVLSTYAFTIRRKTSGFDYIKMKNFCISKNTLSNIKGKWSKENISNINDIRIKPQFKKSS